MALRELNKIMRIFAPPSRKPGNPKSCLHRLSNIYPVGSPSLSASPPGPTTELRTILILGDIVAGQEAGLAIPQAGHDKQWLKDHVYDIQDQAEDGDEILQIQIDEIKAREDMRDVASFWQSTLGH